MVITKAYEEFTRTRLLPYPTPAVAIYDTEQLREFLRVWAIEHGEEPDSPFLTPTECYLPVMHTVVLRHRRRWTGKKKIPTVVGVNPWTAMHEFRHHTQACSLGAREYLSSYEAEIERVLKEREVIRLEYERLLKINLAEAGRWITRQRVRSITFELEAERFSRENWKAFYWIAKKIATREGVEE